jgi:hypothetical protein
MGKARLRTKIISFFYKRAQFPEPVYHFGELFGYEIDLFLSVIPA